MYYLNEDLGYKRNPILFSDKDIYINYDQWLSGNIKSLLIIGLSGSGKSTLGKKIAEQFNAYYVEIDVISFKIGVKRPDRANWLYIKEHDKYLYKYFKENNIPPTVMLQFEDYQDIRKSEIIDKYIHWLCFERDDLDTNPVVIEGGDVAISISNDESLLEVPVIFKGTSVTKSILRRMNRSLDKRGIFHVLKTTLPVLYSQYSKMIPEVNKARETIMNQKEYEYMEESWNLHLWK